MINYPNNNQEHENDNPIAQESFFPYVCGWSRRRGAYVLPALDDLLQDVQCGARPADTLDESLVRIEVALSSLWPEIEDYFFDNVFAGFMECCMSMMRAADIERRGKSPSGRMLGQLIEELAQTLMDLEYTLSVQMVIEDIDEYKRRLARLQRTSFKTIWAARQRRKQMTIRICWTSPIVLRMTAIRIMSVKQHGL